MLLHNTITNRHLHHLIKTHQISHAGNKRLKIFGKLSCKSGKKMKRENRVFFNSEQEAIALGYRPCGHCMKLQYEKWKKDQQFSAQAIARK